MYVFAGTSFLQAYLTKDFDPFAVLDFRNPRAGITDVLLLAGSAALVGPFAAED